MGTSHRLIGLTGGIGSGKSLVARLVREAGVPVLDADDVAREVVAPGTPGYAEIVAAWPDVVAPDGSIDRKHLASIVFGDAGARAKLEAITHPRIVARSLERASALADQGHQLIFYEASLLVETGRYKQLDGLVVVTAPEEIRVRRVMERDGASAGQVRARMAAQLPEDTRVQAATHVISNDAGVDVLRNRVRALVATLRAGA